MIGSTKETPRPSCPTPEKENDPNYSPPPHRQCQAIGEVTGLQTRANGQVNPFKIREDGKLVAWSVDLGNPTAEERAFFTEAPSGEPDIETGVGYGNPSAKISVLKKLKHQRFKLVKESRKVELSSHFGDRPIFTLEKPLRVNKGTFVAITTGNWIPNIAHDPPAATTDGDVWLASRGRKHCGTYSAGASRSEIIAAQQDMIDHSRPHQKIGSTRPYRCRNTAARLLYWAYLAPAKG